MARADLITQMRCKRLSEEEFNYELLTAPPLASLLSITDLGDLNSLVTSPKYSSKPELKNQYQKEILGRRGFKWFHAGTNRNVFRFIEDQRFLLKVVHSRSGLQDNFLEYKNQNYIKPVCTKVFEVSQCGIVETVERVEPILSREQFVSIAPYIFDLLSAKLIGRYVISDVGSKYFRNYGLRLGYGPVLLDFPYVYPLDGDKLYCNHIDNFTGLPCGGVIDYDEGFNELHCEKCGLLYRASDLAKLEEENKIVKGGKMKMRVSVFRGDEEIWTSKKETKKIEKNFIRPHKEKKASFTVAVEINGVTKTIGDKNVGLKHKVGENKKFNKVKVEVTGYKEEKVEQVEEVVEETTTKVEEVHEEEVTTVYSEDDGLGIGKGVAEAINKYLKNDTEQKVNELKTKYSNIESGEMINPFETPEEVSEEELVKEEVTEEDKLAEESVAEEEVAEELEEEVSEDELVEERKGFNQDEHPGVVAAPAVNPTRPIKDQKRSARYDMNSDYWNTNSKK